MRTSGRRATNKCENCGRRGARLRHVTRSYGKGPDLLVVENVPSVSCPHCGASYLTADTLHEIDRLKAHRRTLASRRSMGVAEFSLRGGKTYHWPEPQ